MNRKVLAAALCGAMACFNAAPAAAGDAELWENFDARISGILRQLDDGIAVMNSWARTNNMPQRKGVLRELLDPTDKNDLPRIPVNEGRRQVVKGYCKGVSRDSMGRFGPILPGWARSIMTTCGIIDEVASNTYYDHWHGKGFDTNCKTLKHDAEQFMKAGPVAVRPEVQARAQHLGEDMYFYWQAICAHKTKNARVNPNHPELYGDGL